MPFGVKAQMTARNAPRIFISYRREDTIAYAGRLFDRVNGHFGSNSVFMDIDTIEPGVDFVEVLQNTVACCDVLIAVIGRNWLAAVDDDGNRRLDSGEDFIRIEIATALQRGVRVIPLLVAGARMPKRTDLPKDLQALIRRHAFDLPDIAFHASDPSQ